MFNLSEWLKDNLVQSCIERSFTVAQVNLMAYKYKEDAKLTEEDFNAITAVTAEVQAEIDTENQPPDEIPAEPIE